MSRNCARPRPSTSESLFATGFFPKWRRWYPRCARQAQRLWAVSSTNKWVIAEGVRDFGIPEERVLAAEVRVVDGLIGSEILDVPTDQGKAAALARVGLTKPDAVFGNSVHDLAMLDIALHPYPINPSPALLKAAARSGWGYFMPQGSEDAAANVGGE